MLVISGIPEAEDLHEQVASFDLDALSVVLQGLLPADAKPFSTLAFLAEGGFHHVFTASNGDSEVVVRINNNLPANTTAKCESEIATQRYVYEHTQIPVPRVLYSNATPNNAVGARFDVQEKIDGIPLFSIWDALSVQNKEKMVRSYAKIRAQLLGTSFTQIGSLTQDGSIGPIQAQSWMEERRSNLLPQATFGPFKSARQYLLARPRIELTYVDAHPEVLNDDVAKDDELARQRNRNPSQDKRLLIETLMKLIEWYPDASLDAPLNSEDTEVDSANPAAYILHHMDLNLSNILVDSNNHTHILAVLDWEEAIIVPRWASIVAYDFLHLQEDPRDDFVEFGWIYEPHDTEEAVERSATLQLRAVYEAELRKQGFQQLLQHSYERTQGILLARLEEMAWLDVSQSAKLGMLLNRFRRIFQLVHPNIAFPDAEIGWRPEWTERYKWYEKWW